MKHNTLKKVLSLLLVICMMASCAGCIPGEEDPTVPSTIETTGPTENTPAPTDGTTAPTVSTDSTTSPTEETIRIIMEDTATKIRRPYGLRIFVIVDGFERRS